MFYGQNTSIYINFGGDGGGHTWATYHFLFIIQKYGKSTRPWPVLKSNFTSFWFLKKILAWIIKKLRKGGPKNVQWGARQENGGRQILAMLKWAGWRPVMPHTVWTISLPLRKKGTLCQKDFFFSFIYQHLPFRSSTLFSFYSFHHSMVGQIVFCSGITHLQPDHGIFLNYCT